MSDGGFFSSEQVEYLSAMGYAVLALQTDSFEATPAPPVVAPAPPVTIVTNVTNVTPPPPVSKAPDFVPAPPAEVAVARAAAVRATAPQSALERALLAATGQTRRVDARAVLDELQVDIDALRDDPQAKRELWPRLRAIRAKRR